MAETPFSNEDVLEEKDVIQEKGTGVDEEEVESEERILKPFDPALIRIDTRHMTVDLLLDRIHNKELNLTPDFQRQPGIWKPDARSKLIESMLIRIPLPAFYMDATNDDKWLVVDGLQRLTTLKEFVLDKTLKLDKLDFLKSLEGKYHDDLPRSYQRRIKETQVTVYVIEKGTPEDATFNIFKRINTGGLPLSSQEIRNALYQGKGTKFLVQLAQSSEFQNAVDRGIKDERMADRECVLRFLAFVMTPYTSYDKDLETFLNNAMVLLNKKSDAELETLRQKFYRAMKAAADIFGKDAFRKRLKKGAPRQPINKPLFEIWSVNLDRLTDEQVALLVERKALLQDKFIRLVNEDHMFFEAISYGTGSIKKVRLRFEAITKLIEDTLL